jgi:Chaperone of endosialidase
MQTSFKVIIPAVLIGAGMLIQGSAQAMPNGAADGIRSAADSLKLVESVQYVWNGRNYCWYESGWKGPGWYVCSYGPWVSGLWWGGGHGWHNWHWHGHHNRQKHRGGGHHERGHHVSHHGARHKAGHHVTHHRGGHQVRHQGGGRHVAAHRGGGHRGGGRGGGRRSDIRLKQDIIPLVRLNNGLELYRFSYKGSDHTVYVGVIAQEVQRIEPSAVWRDHDGYLAVNYDRIGLKFMTWKEWLRRKDRGS